ncbi:MAG: hypothetical protein CMJ40_06530 [Phycisphaerae bacterium]|nr:hypothetical protein [Phycisphaerae bacterium]|tara:strand:- start:11359 stop:11943 length:585 start_codon:yes stop_codon:yes gene_type:complete
MVKPKFFFVIGPESSGSTLTARICAQVLLGVPFDSERSEEWEDDKGNRVWHVSLPSGPEATFADVNQWVRDYSDTHDLHFILTTRDITLSEYSRRGRFMRRGSYEVKRHSDRARDIMLQVMSMDYPWYISSYETMIYLGKPYLDLLYEFMGVESDFMPSLRDGNLKRIQSMGLVDNLKRTMRRTLFNVRTRDKI